jgi:hypothetical protein
LTRAPSGRPCSGLLSDPRPICRFDLAWCRERDRPVARRRRLLRLPAPELSSLPFLFLVLALALGP